MVSMFAHRQGIMFSCAFHLFPLPTFFWVGLRALGPCPVFPDTRQCYEVVADKGIQLQEQWRPEPVEL